jgi:hypothetical protein
MSAIIKPIRILPRSGGSARVNAQPVELRAAGSKQNASPHSSWSAMVAARHLAGPRPGRWIPLELIWRAAARRICATQLSLWQSHLHLNAKFLSHLVAAAPLQNSQPQSAMPFVFREARAWPSLHAPGQTLPAFPRLGDTARPAALSPNRGTGATRYSLPQLIESRVSRRAANADLAPLASRRFTLGNRDEESSPFATQLSYRAARNESAYLPLVRAFVSQIHPAADPEHSTFSSRSQKHSSQHFIDVEAAARPASPRLDIHKLADEVIQQIDRRIISTRERFGKR